MIRSPIIPRLGALALLTGLAALPFQAMGQERRVFQVAPGPRIVTQELPALNDSAAIRRWLCPHGGTPMRGRPGRCDGRGVARLGGNTATAGSDPEVAGWYADLPPASRRQQACPVGTVAAEARANPGTVRCVPG